MQRVLCIVSSMNRGGAETFLMKMLRQLDRTEFILDFCICSDAIGVYESEIVGLGSVVYHIPTKSRNYKGFKDALFRIVHDNEYKFILKTSANAMGFLDMKICKRAGAKLCAFRSSNSSDGGRLKMRVLNVLGRVLFSRYIDIKIAPSDLAAIYTFGKRAYKTGQVVILRNGLNLDYYAFSIDGRNSIRTEFGIKRDAFVIGHVGRFDEQKNHGFLIDLFEEFHRKRPGSILLLVGDGKLKTTIEQTVNELCLSDAVIFAGSRSDIPNLLSSMDVFILPSLYEGMPNTVIEAQVNGLKCLITDTITKEANVVGSVDFIPLAQKEEWVNRLNESERLNDRDNRQLLKDAGYDIIDVAKSFRELFIV